MSARGMPRIARLLLRRVLAARYGDDLEGDLIEELAAGRTRLWLWRQLACALLEHAGFIARQQIMAFVVATLFFLGALWFIAPLTYPLLDWARALESQRMLVLLAWLAGVPVILGGLAAAAERRQRVGAILLSAALAYLTPVTMPFNSAVCDLCARPAGAAMPLTVLLLTPACSALLAGLGAWTAGRFHPTLEEKIR